MSYKDRIKEMIYTAPSGAEFTLKYNDLSRAGGRKAPVTEFPGQNQGAVQDLGMTTPTFPVSCFIDGEDYDQTSDSFWSAMEESGPGVLSHPRWGEIDVLPVPNSQTESFVSGMGRADFDITFIKVDADFFNYQSEQPNAAAAVSALVDSVIEQSVADQPTSLSTIGEEKTKLSVELILTSISDHFQSIADLGVDAKNLVSERVTYITNNIDDLVAAPDLLQEKMSELYRTIDDEETNIQNKIDSFQGIIDDIASFNLQDSITDIFVSLGLIYIANVTAAGGACAEAVQYGDFKTRNQAVDAITYFVDFRDSVNDLLQTFISAGVDISYNLQKSTTQSMSDSLYYLVSQTVNLSLEKSEILSSDITTAEFVYNVYGDTERLDEFIEYNNLTGDKIICLSRGDEVRFYG